MPGIKRLDLFNNNSKNEIEVEPIDNISSTGKLSSKGKKK